MPGANQHEYGERIKTVAVADASSPSRDQRARPAEGVHRSGDNCGRLWQIATRGVPWCSGQRCPGAWRGWLAGQCPDLDQVVGEYPVPAPDGGSLPAVQVGAVPAVAAFKVADPPL